MVRVLRVLGIWEISTIVLVLLNAKNIAVLLDGISLKNPVKRPF